MRALAMKILLTGHPRVGKSTLIQKITNRLEIPFRGIIAKELRDASGAREGFEARNFRGETRVFAHISAIQSDAVVGNKYRVDLDAINAFVVPEIQPSTRSTDELVIIDEIGRMQSLSSEFLRTVSAVLDSDTSFLGTIVLDPEPWSLPFKHHPDVLLIEVTQKNRRKLPQVVVSILQTRSSIQALTKAQQQCVLNLLRHYIPTQQIIQIKKLLQNAIPYILKNAVRKTANTPEGAQTYAVTGNTRDHLVVRKKETSWHCDCDLFLGIGDYMNQAGECSHIQAAQLLEAQEPTSPTEHPVRGRH